MSDTPDLIHPRDEIMRMMERIYRFRMTTTSGGNLSIREESGDVWITPARLDKGSLRREDIVRIGPDGAVDGPHRPSSEQPFHQAIYETRPDVRAVVHAHPVALVAFSICGDRPDPRILYQCHRICGTVGFAPYALPGSARLGRNIAAAFAGGCDCVVLENHGVVVGGPDLQTAFERFETLEFAAKTIIKARLLGDVRLLDDEDLARVPLAHPLPTMSQRPLPVSSREKELRRQLALFVRRCYQQRLMISTEGAFSVRLEGDAFLITPHRKDRSTLDLHDLVLVTRDGSEAGHRPSTAAVAHRAVYRQHPEVESIVNAYPVNATAYSVTSSEFVSRTIPESYLFLREVQRAGFGARFEEAEGAGRCGLERPVTILDNDGVMVCGASVLDAFDRLEVLEATAEAMINSRPIGRMQPMPPAVIEELAAAFLKRH